MRQQGMNFADIAELGGSTKLVVLHYEKKAVGFVDKKGKPKAGLQFSIKKKADRCMPLYIYILTLCTKKISWKVLFLLSVLQHCKLQLS